MATAWSTLHSLKPIRPPPSSRTPPHKVKSRSNKTALMSISTLDPYEQEQEDTTLSKSSSLAGKKRPRESAEGSGNLSLADRKASRRTKSTGDAREGKSAKDREAFQRGLIAVFVPKALQDSISGDQSHYNDLLAHFLPTPTTPHPPLPPLLPLIRAIAANVSHLSPTQHTPLVSAILALPWATGDERFVKAYVGWAGVLVSAHPSWAKQVVDMAVEGLSWQPPMQGTIPVSRKVFHARHHLLLSHLLSLIPTLPNVLGPILVKRFPNKREPEVSQTTWVRNMCELVGYCPELTARIWGVIVDRMLRIDSEITNALDEEDDDDDEMDSDDEDEDGVVAEGLSSQAGPSMLSASMQLDPFEVLTSQEVPKDSTGDDDDAGSDSDPDVDELSSVDGEDSDGDAAEDAKKQDSQREKRRQAVRSMKGKLDGMLLYFFQHLEEYMGEAPPSQPALDLAAETMSISGSGQSTPTSEFAPQLSASINTLLPSRRLTRTSAQSLSHFQTLLNIFTRSILPTSSTQHIPFLLFLSSSFSPAHTDLLLGVLVSQALYGTLSANNTVVAQPVSLSQRVAATVYIGSIVCRARFVTDESARQVIAYLLAYIDGKLLEAHHTKKTNELPLFYAVCQATMLIFCFRWRALTNDKEADNVLGEMEMEGESDDAQSTTEDGRWMRDLDVLQRAITSELNPLLGCNPTVTSTFAKVAHHTNFAYCFSILEANQQRSASSRSLANQAQGSSYTAVGSNHLPPSLPSRSSSLNTSQNTARRARQTNIDSGLDSYFPFDPFNLPRSKRYIDRIYRTWGEVAIPLGDDDSDLDDDDDKSESDSESSSSLGTSNPSHTHGRSLPKAQGKIGSWSDARKRVMADNGLSSSLEGMSISPGLTGFMQKKGQ